MPTDSHGFKVLPVCGSHIAVVSVGVAIAGRDVRRTKRTPTLGSSVRASVTFDERVSFHVLRQTQDRPPLLAAGNLNITQSVSHMVTGGTAPPAAAPTPQTADTHAVKAAVNRGNKE